jgi:hypothetical protein
MRETLNGKIHQSSEATKVKFTRKTKIPHDRGNLENQNHTIKIVLESILELIRAVKVSNLNNDCVSLHSKISGISKEISKSSIKNRKD